MINQASIDSVTISGSLLPRVIDLTDHVLEIQLLEDISSLGATVNVAILDTNGLFSLLNISGGETVDLTFSLFGIKHRNKMRLTQVSHKKLDELGSMVNLLLVSEYTYINSYTSIAGVYEGSAIEIIKKIASNIDLPILSAVSSKGMHKVVIPENVLALDAIKSIMATQLDADNTNLFCYRSFRHDLNVITSSTALNEKPANPIEFVYKLPIIESERDKISEINNRTIFSMDIESLRDTVLDLKGPYVGITAHNLDIKNKTYTKTQKRPVEGNTTNRFENRFSVHLGNSLNKDLLFDSIGKAFLSPEYYLTDIQVSAKHFSSLNTIGEMMKIKMAAGSNDDPLRVDERLSGDYMITRSTLTVKKDVADLLLDAIKRL